MERDHDRLAAELLRGLRGSLTQEALSLRMGFKSNVAYAWEAGRRFPSGPAFLEVARVVGIDVGAAITKFSGSSDLDWSEPTALARWLDALRGTTSVSDVARRAGRHRSAVARWLSGAAAPRLPDLLLLIDAITERVLDFVVAFVPPTWLKSAQAEWDQLQAARQLAGASPWTAAVLLALELDERGKEAVPTRTGIAARLGVTEDTVSAALATLLQARRIAVRGGRYRRIDGGHPVDTGSEAALRSFWTEVARDRLAKGAPGVGSWNLGVVSSADYDRIEELHRRTFEQIVAIVASSAGADRLVLTSWSLVALEGVGGPDAGIG